MSQSMKDVVSGLRKEYADPYESLEAEFRLLQKENAELTDALRVCMTYDTCSGCGVGIREYHHDDDCPYLALLTPEGGESDETI